MKKIITCLMVLSVLSLSIVMAVDGNWRAGKSETYHTYYYEKDPTTWEIVEDGAMGKMTFNKKTDRFVFNGDGLEVGEDYTLIYYPDPWPGNNVQCLGEGTSNKGGNLNLAGDFVFSNIPTEEDENEDGAKIWLVLSSDVVCGDKMTSWNPTEYLFEYDLI